MDQMQKGMQKKVACTCNSPALVLKPGRAFRLSLTALASSKCKSLLPTARCSSLVAGTCRAMLRTEDLGPSSPEVLLCNENCNFQRRARPFFVLDFIPERVVWARGFDWLHLPISYRPKTSAPSCSVACQAYAFAFQRESIRHR